MNNKYILSICIPTYNYGQYISDTLNSIIDQIDDDIEIIIGDSASTDNTESIVQNFIKKNSNIKYYNFQKKSGIDIDLSKTVDKANGKYCWLLSSDDIPVKNAVFEILKSIKENPNVIITNRIICDKFMSPIKENASWTNKKIEECFFDFNDPLSLTNYLKSLTSIGGLFSYMSVLIFKREDWLTVDSEKKYLFNCYAHAYNLFKILKLKNSKLKYLPKQLVLFRGFNDSFASDGYISRILIDFKGYKLLQESLFTNSATKELFLKVMKKEHPWYYLIRVRQEIKNESEWKTIKQHLRHFNYSKYEINMLYILGSSASITNLLRKFKKIFKI